MDKLVRWDLHIHSHASKSYEPNKIVDNSTIDKRSTLIKKLEENKINVFSVTDHNIFDANLFLAFKEDTKSSNEVKCVLPGVEFTIEIKEKTFEPHIRIYFDFQDEEHARNLQNLINEEKLLLLNGAKETNEFKFTLDSLKKIIFNLGVSIAISVDQNSSFIKEKQSKREIGSEENLYSFKVITALETKSLNSKNIIELSSKKGLRLPSLYGSDCHEWDFYPRHDELTVQREKFYFESYAQPTFLGLIMTMTFPNQRLNKVLPTFSNPISGLKINDDLIKFSKGVNVIIGGNGSGKSTLARLLNLRDDESNVYNKKLVDGNNMKVEYEKNNGESLPRRFLISQGQIVEDYNKNKLLSQEINLENVLENFSLKYRSLIKKMLELIKSNISVSTSINALKSYSYELKEIKKTFYQNVSELPDITISVEDLAKGFKLNFDVINTLFEKSVKEIERLGLSAKIKAFQETGKEINDVINNDYLTWKSLSIATSILNQSIKTYNGKVQLNSTSDDQIAKTLLKTKNAFVDNVISMSILGMQGAKMELTEEIKSLESCDLDKTENKSAYEINGRLDVYEFKGSIFNQILKKLFNKGYDWTAIDSLENFINAVKGLKDSNLKLDQVIEYLKTKSEEVLKDFLKTKTTIRNPEKNEDIGHTFGEIAKVFYKYKIDNESAEYDVLIVDQPEDNISQQSIRDDLIRIIDTNRPYKQIFIVTHSPILAVNLDPDNIIFLENKNGVISFETGPLDANDNKIIDIICKNMDSGLETINERLKLYEI